MTPERVQSEAEAACAISCHAEASSDAITSVLSFTLRYVPVFLFFSSQPLPPCVSSHICAAEAEGAVSFTVPPSALSRSVLPSTFILKV